MKLCENVYLSTRTTTISTDYKMYIELLFLIDILWIKSHADRLKSILKINLRCYNGTRISGETINTSLVGTFDTFFFLLGRDVNKNV